MHTEVEVEVTAAVDMVAVDMAVVDMAVDTEVAAMAAMAAMVVVTACMEDTVVMVVMEVMEDTGVMAGTVDTDGMVAMEEAIGVVDIIQGIMVATDTVILVTMDQMM